MRVLKYKSGWQPWATTGPHLWDSGLQTVAFKSEKWAVWIMINTQTKQQIMCHIYIPRKTI